MKTDHPFSPEFNGLAAFELPFITYRGMRWAKQEFTKGEVNRAGELLCAHEFMEQDYVEALEVVNNWRAIHACPLQTLKMALNRRAVRVSPNAIVSQRTKRVAAIQLKLRENHARGMHMSLADMHDIAGCRAVLPDVGMVHDLVKVYELATAKNALRGGIFQRKYDYITEPKDTGYRSVHLVYRYYSDSKALKDYTGLRVEIQIRSRLQHYWATAVETVGFFTGQALKSNLGDLPWKRFFALVANELARLEKSPLVPGAPADEKEAKKELAKYSHQLTRLEAFNAATQVISVKAEQKPDAELFLLQLDIKERKIRSFPFTRKEAVLAQQQYIELEAKSDPKNVHTVLVSVNSISALQKAYPSFYLDISDFVRVLKTILGE